MIYFIFLISLIIFLYLTHRIDLPLRICLVLFVFGSILYIVNIKDISEAILGFSLIAGIVGLVGEALFDRPFRD